MTARRFIGRRPNLSDLPLVAGPKVSKVSDSKELTIGDVVSLISGGPSMTVEGIVANGSVQCVWFHRLGGATRPYETIQRATLPAATLQKAER